MNVSLLNSLKARSLELQGETVAKRRFLHAHPELSYHEVATGQYIAAQLKALGVPHTHGVAENGVVAVIEGKNPDKGVVGLRADFDALPILEENDVPYKSTQPGVMHACGHDAHTSSLLSTTRILWETRHEWSGTVKLVFQPAEEKLPGGASIMIAEGVMENPAPLSMIGQHVAPNIEAGLVGFRSGIYMASADELYVRIEGRGGHGAMPHTTVDPVAMSAQILVALQQVVSRMADPTMPTVLTFGKIESVGGTTNVIPDAVLLEGTFRAMNEAWRNEAHRKMVQVATAIAESMGGRCHFNIVKGYPVLVNNPEVTEKARAAAVAYMGEKQVIELPLRMTAEDFAYYAQAVPSCFYRLGTGNTAKGITHGLHTPRFDIDESSLAHSPGLMAWLAINELETK